MFEKYKKKIQNLLKNNSVFTSTKSHLKDVTVFKNYLASSGWSIQQNCWREQTQCNDQYDTFYDPSSLHPEVPIDHPRYTQMVHHCPLDNLLCLGHLRRPWIVPRPRQRDEIRKVLASSNHVNREERLICKLFKTNWSVALLGPYNSASPS